MKLFFTADLHLGHGNIIKYCDRPFLTDEDRAAKETDAAAGIAWDRSHWRMTSAAVRMMDKTIIDAINAKVGTDDELWILGDFAYGIRDQYLSKCEDYRKRIRCKNVKIIWGNHDRFEIKPLFSRYYDQCSINIPGRRTKIIVNHFAMAIWEGSHRGNIHLYGHSHTKAEPSLDKMMPNRRSMDVGVDNAFKLFGEFRPFSLDADILPLMDARTGCAIDYHGED